MYHLNTGKRVEALFRISVWYILDSNLLLAEKLVFKCQVHDKSLSDSMYILKKEQKN